MQSALQRAVVAAASGGKRPAALLLGRALATSTGDGIGIRKVGVVGLGLMGHGITQVTAMATEPTYQVVGIESTEEAARMGQGRIESSLAKVLQKEVAKGRMTQQQADERRSTVLSRLSYSTSKDALADCDLVVEAIVENRDLKLPFYKELGQITKPECILASNTSSLAIREMAEASGREDRVVGLHFFNPVQLMRLVEVVRTDATDPEVFERCKKFVLSVGKHPVSCRDTPGFIVNRLLVPALAQAMLMLDRGDASLEDIDRSMELGAGHPMGPLTLADYVGLDTCLFILKGWVDNFPNEPAFVVPKCLSEKVAKGKLGRKSGEGFYKWDGDRRVGVA